MDSQSRWEAAKRMLEQGRYLEAVKYYVQQPINTEKEYGCFLHVLEGSLDHVTNLSPAHLPQLLEMVYSKYGNDETILLILGKKCYDNAMYTHGEFFLQMALKADPDCLSAKESLQILSETVVDRWHFLMLNDITRNSFYARAIASAVGRIPDCTVLDIGSGTGLLSMLAVRSGAKRVYACERNATMVTLSHDILAANGMADSVTVIHKMSTQASVPEDLPERVSLVVTETVDAGLLGEGIVPTLRHAWEELLLPRQQLEVTNQIVHCGHVIPCGAVVHVMAIECPEIARQSRLLSDEVGGLSFHDITLEGTCKREDESLKVAGERHQGGGRRRGGGSVSWWREVATQGRVCGEGDMESRLCREPYTCEKLSSIRGGYRALSQSCPVLQFDFTDPQISLPSAHIRLPIVESGCLDAIATYFDLHLDPKSSFSTSPIDSGCSSWEQAIFPVMCGGEGGRGGVRVEKGDVVFLHASCSETFLKMNIENIVRGRGGEEERGAGEGVRCDDGMDVPAKGRESLTGENNVSREHPVSELSVHFVDRAVLSRLNDSAYLEVYRTAILQTLNDMEAMENGTESSSVSSLDSGMANMELGTATAESEHSGGGECWNGMETEASGIENEHRPSLEGKEEEKEEEEEEKEEEEEEEEEEEDMANCVVLDMSHEFPILGLVALKLGADFVQAGRCHLVYRLLLEAVARNNGLQEKMSVKWVELGVTSAPQLVWDVVLCDVVSPQGVLRPGVFEELEFIRSHQSHSDTVILPARVTVHCMGISSPTLRAQATVLGSIPTLSLDIARFVNKYQVSHFIDLDFGCLHHNKLTEETQLFSLDLSSLSATPLVLEKGLCLPVVQSGSLCGVVYWFSLHFPHGGVISTGPDREEGAHWHQAVFLLSEDMSVETGQQLRGRALIRDSYLDISITSTD